MIDIRKIAVLILCTLASLGAQAETLWDIYEQAVRNDPAIREAEANMQATMQAKPRARAFLLPQLSGTAGWNNRDSDGTGPVPGIGGTTISGPTESDIDTTNWSLDFTQTILNTDQWRRLKRADKEVAQAQIDYQVAQQDLMIRTAEAYFNVLAAQDTLTSEQANKDAIARQLEQATRRFEVGLIAITDVKEAQAAYDNALALEIAAQRSLAAAKERLREVTGQYPQTLAQPGEDLPLIPPAPQVEQDWVDISLQQNLKLESARIGTEITRDNVKIAESGHLPTLDLNASYGNTDISGDRTFFNETINPPVGLDVTSDQSTDTDTTFVGVQLNLPIYQGGGVSALVEEEVYRHRASRENYEKVAREAERETRDGYLGVIAEIARVQALARSVESNETAVEATDAGYEVGTRTIVDVLVARQSLFRAKTDFARSRYDYLNNVLKLKRAAGTLQPDDIKQLNAWLVTDKTLQATPGRGTAPEIQLQPGTPTTGGALDLPGMQEPVPANPEPQAPLEDSAE